MSRLDDIKNLYRNIFGRNADDDGLNHYLNSSLSIQDISNALTFSAEGLEFSRARLLDYLPSGICAEIGTFEGAYADCILNRNNPKKLYLIDAWESYDCGYDDDTIMLDQQKHNNMFNEIVKRYKDKNNVEVIRSYSKLAIEKFDNDYFDWVYIDANHSYEGCMNDLKAIDSKVKDSGYICGHDYETKAIKRFGVVDAVNDFIKEKNYYLTFITKESDYRSYVISKTEKAHKEFLNKL